RSEWYLILCDVPHARVKAYSEVPGSVARGSAFEESSMSSSSTLTKGLDMLRLMGQYPHGAPAAVFAKESGLPFSTAYRLLNTLIEAGFAEFEPATKQYRIGLQVFELSQKISAS